MQSTKDENKVDRKVSPSEGPDNELEKKVKLAEVEPYRSLINLSNMNHK